MSTDSLTESTGKNQARTYPLWRNRDFLLLTGGQGVSAIGTQVSLFAFPLLVLAITHSPAQAGLIAALRGAPEILFSLLAGALVDRWNRKRVMLLCDIGRAIAFASIPLTYALGMINPMQLYLVALIEGTLATFFRAANMAMLPHVVAPEQLPTAAGQNEMFNSSSVLIGPALGGIFYSLSASLPFLSDAVSYIISVISLLFIQTRFQNQHTEKHSQRNIWSKMQDGIVWLWRQRLICFTTCVIGGLVIASIGYTLVIIVIAQQLHIGSFYLGLIFASGGAGSIVGAILVGPLQKRYTFAQIMIISAWIWSLTWLLFAIASNPFLLAIANGVSYTIAPILFVAQFSYRLKLIPDELQGRVNSICHLIEFGGEPLGLALTGVLLQQFGALSTILILFVPQLVLAIAVTFNKSVKGK